MWFTLLKNQSGWAGGHAWEGEHASWLGDCSKHLWKVLVSHSLGCEILGVLLQFFVPPRAFVPGSSLLTVPVGFYKLVLLFQSFLLSASQGNV